MNKTKALEQLIESRKFDWVNSHITSKLFPPQKVGTDFKLFTIDKYMSSEDVVKMIEKEGYRAANIYELLSWQDWNEKDWIAALGSVGEVDGSRCVPYLHRDDSKRDLDLGWWGDGWDSSYRFLAVCNLSLKYSEPRKLNTLTLGNLEKRIEKLEAWACTINQFN